MSTSSNSLERAADALREHASGSDDWGEGLEELADSLEKAHRFSLLPGRGVDEEVMWMIYDRQDLNSDDPTTVEIAEEYLENHGFVNYLETVVAEYVPGLNRRTGYM